MQAESRAGLLAGRRRSAALVVVVEESGRLVEVRTVDTGEVAVDPQSSVAGSPDLCVDPSVPREQRPCVHHFAERDDSGLCTERCHCLGTDPRTRALKIGCRHTGWYRKAGLERGSVVLATQCVHALGPEHVPDLVGVGDDACHAPGHDCLRIPREGEHCRLDVHMGVDQSRRDVFHRQFAVGGVLAEPDHLPPIDRDGALLKNAGEHVNEGPPDQPVDGAHPGHRWAHAATHVRPSVRDSRSVRPLRRHTGLPAAGRLVDPV